MYSRILTNLDALHARPRALLFVLAAAALVTVPALFSGFWLDDYVHINTIEGRGLPNHTLDLFRFGMGDAEAMSPLIVEGAYPWYTLPELKLHFFRPLSCATMVLDHTLFGHSGFLYHLHCSLWYVLLVFSAWAVLRRSVTVKLALLALLIYALDEGHLIPAVWWSNRNAIVAAAPALLGLAAHMRWREDQWLPGLPLSLLGYVVGLLGGETALGIFGYLIAYEMFARTDSYQRRVLALTGGGLVAMSYLLFYKLAGFGVYGSGVYLDPVSELPEFLALLPERLLALLLTQFFVVPADLPFAVAALRLPVIAASVVGAIVLGLALRKLWPTLDVDTRRSLRWLGVGALISALPSLATFPAGRLLILPSLGGAVFIAVLIQFALQKQAEKALMMPRRVGHLFVVLHIIVTPLFWIGTGAAFPLFTYFSEEAFRSMEIDDAKAPDELIFSLHAADPYTGFYPLVRRNLLGYPAPKGWQNLSVAPYTHRVVRTHPNRFEVSVVDGEMFTTHFEGLLRSRAFPFSAGDKVDLSSYTVQIMEVGTLGPRRFALEFPEELESDSYRFLSWQEGQLKRFEWPPIGTSVDVSPDDGYFAWEHFKKQLPLSRGESPE